MKILEEFFIGKRKYLCVAKLIVNSQLLHKCKDVYFNKYTYFIVDAEENRHEVTDEKVIAEADKYFIAKSLDVIYPDSWQLQTKNMKQGEI